MREFQFTLAGHTRKILLALDPDSFVSDRNLEIMGTQNMLPEPEVLNVMATVIKPGDTVVDAGANVGFFTIFMSKLVGEKGTVVAIEPDPRNRVKLKKNIDINDCQNVDIYNSPLSDETREVDFHLCFENGLSNMFNNSLVETGGVAETIRLMTRTLGDILKENDTPSFMKMDVEGAEKRALNGLQRRIPFVICEANEIALLRAGDTIKNLRGLMESIKGYDTWALDERGRAPAYIHPQQRIKTSRPNTNILFASARDVHTTWREVHL